MVALVTGGNGQLGQALQHIVSDYPEIEFHFLSADQADITDKTQLDRVFKSINPDFCINAAAYTAVDKSENEPEKAALINVEGAKNLAETCKRVGATLIHISTDFVFDGQKLTPYSETDSTNPQGVYGQTKLSGERAIQAMGGKYYILRTAWLYSQFGANFMKTMLRLAAERDSLSVVDDQIGTPTHAIDLARAIVTVMQHDKPEYGIYHYSNEGETSWYGFAKKIFELKGIAINLKPIPTSEFPTPAKRPAYSVLDKSKIKRTFGLTIPHWETSLKESI